MNADASKSPSSLDMRHQKLVFKMQYLGAELAETEAYMCEAKREFAVAYNTCISAYSEAEIIKINAKIQKTSQLIKPELSKDGIDEQELKKLFRKIAEVTHPDKLAHMKEEEQEFRDGLFEKAKKACEELNWHELSVLAQTLKLSIPTLTESHIKMLECNSALLTKKIEALKCTYAWQWYQCHDPEERNKFMHAYVQDMMQP